jgi:hypothetical protein
MSGGAGDDGADGGSRLPAQSAAEHTHFWMPGQQGERCSLDQRGVWRTRRGTTGSGSPRWQTKLGGAGWIGMARVVGHLALHGATAQGTVAFRH